MRLIFLLAALSAAPAFACGPDSDCLVGGRSYRLYLPEGGAPNGAFLFAHGYRGSGAGSMGNPALRRLADALGMAFVALDSEGPDWAIAHTPQAPGQAENREFVYVGAVLDDLVAKGIDPARIVATGFSAGGMLTWTLACGMSERFAGFVPMSGTFWAPVPDSCPAPPANLVHIHGDADPVVPQAGRAIGPARQGSVAKALEMYREEGGFEPAGTGPAPGGMHCARERNPAGQVLEFCSFAGGHDFSTERLRYGIEEVLGAE